MKQIGRRVGGIAAIALGVGASASPAQAEGELVLQALTPTSGTSPGSLVDGDRATGWRPYGEGSGEGVLLRLEERTKISALRIQPCTDSQPKLGVYFDGRLLDHPVANRPGQTLTAKLRGSARARSIFIKAKSDDFCLSEVSLVDASGNERKLRAPRSVPGTIETSSTLEPAAAYHPAYVFDKRTDFGWVEGAKGHGQGEWFEVRFAKAQKISGLEIWNGYQRSPDHFRKNARLKRIEVWADGKSVGRFRVKNRLGPQTIRLKRPVEAKVVRIVAKQVAKGRRYADLVLSELRFLGPEGPFSVETALGTELRDALSRAIDGTALGEAVDRQWSSYCDLEKTVTLKLRSNHSFAYYEHFEIPDESYEEVFDGAWVPAKGAKAPWAALKLYGRRHRVETNWAPYEGEQTEAKTRVAGGKLRVARVSDLGLAGLRKTRARLSGRCAKLSKMDQATFDELVARKAIFVKGRAISDIFWRSR